MRREEHTKIKNWNPQPLEVYSTTLLRSSVFQTFTKGKPTLRVIAAVVSFHIWKNYVFICNFIILFRINQVPIAIGNCSKRLKWYISVLINIKYVIYRMSDTLSFLKLTIMNILKVDYTLCVIQIIDSDAVLYNF